jgi:hypothetical protein
MSAEEIAAVAADLRAGRAVNALPDDPKLYGVARAAAVRAGTVVDATAIYESLASHPRDIYLYEDHPCIAPPWENALLCYLNEHGNVVAMALEATELRDRDPEPQWKSDDLLGPSGEAVEHEVDWARVRWRLDVTVWIGGRSGDGRFIPTHGPRHLWRLAVYDGGEPADINWLVLQAPQPGDDTAVITSAHNSWGMALLVLLESLNFMGCRNVALVEPQRPRPERRRLARLGVSVHTINVFPVGRSTRSSGKPTGEGVPLTSVVGHFSHYGSQYGRGLLFGRIAGKFWIPQHARGDASLGVSEADYRLVP